MVTYNDQIGWISQWDSWYCYKNPKGFDEELSLSGEFFQLNQDQELTTQDGIPLFVLPRDTKFKFEKKVNFLELGFHYRKSIPITIYSGKYAGGKGWISTKERNYQGLIETTPREKIILWGLKIPVALGISVSVILFLVVMIMVVLK